VGIAVTLDAPAGREPPPLVLRGTGAPFRLDSSHPATTLAIDASVPARPAMSFGDPVADVPVVFRLTTVAVDPGLPGQLWLSNGHYLGDGTTGDDAADTGATGGPATVTSPAGRPLRACEGVTDACATRTGLVLRRYRSSFDNVDSPPFDVRWEWSVVGAPPGASVTVQPLDGETLDAGIVAMPPWPVVVGVLVAGVLVLGLAVVGVRSRRRRPGAGPGNEP
jgi:hypothetical protein